MPIRAITFDCAQTLVKVKWDPIEFAIRVARTMEISVPIEGGPIYASLMKERFAEFLSMNLKRNPSLGTQFHIALNTAWLRAIGTDSKLATPLTEKAEELAFGPDSDVFKLYPETRQALESLATKGFHLGVVSNWDYTLHRVLDMFGLNEVLEIAVASLEEGIEKPDPKLFQIALARKGWHATETLHVGDDLVDDVQGAEAAGIHPLLIDRTRPSLLPGRISSLNQIGEVIDCLS